jgi:hypothetical protein
MDLHASMSWLGYATLMQHAALGRLRGGMRGDEVMHWRTWRGTFMLCVSVRAQRLLQRYRYRCRSLRQSSECRTVHVAAACTAVRTAVRTARAHYDSLCTACWSEGVIPTVMYTHC